MGEELEEVGVRSQECVVVDGSVIEVEVERFLRIEKRNEGLYVEGAEI